MDFQFKNLGVLRSPFKDKFGIPRQSGLLQHIHGSIHFNSEWPHLAQALDGLLSFSHIWVIFVFHEGGQNQWKPRIRPPRFDGRKKIGVLASRSPHRPNPIGLSALKIESLRWESPSKPILHVSGVDILDETPILDIKPYIPYCDSYPQALSGWAEGEPPRYSVFFSEKVEDFLRNFQEVNFHGGVLDASLLRAWIQDILEWDPRPTYQRRKDPAFITQPIFENLSQRIYGFDLMGYEIKYTHCAQGGFYVLSLDEP